MCDRSWNVFANSVQRLSKNSATLDQQHDFAASRYGVGSQLTPTLEVLAVTRDITDEFTDVTLQAQTDLEENWKEPTKIPANTVT